MAVEIIQYVKKTKHNKKVGVLIAVLGPDKKVYLGWSKCNKLDKFQTTKGKEIAAGRAMSSRTPLNPIAASIREDMSKFEKRIRNYYKDKEVVLSFSYSKN